MEAHQTQTETVVEHFENVDGCSVADVSEGRVELTVTCMENGPNQLPGGRQSSDVLVDDVGLQLHGRIHRREHLRRGELT